MALILRRTLNRALTHDELDNNLVYLDINEWKLQSYEKGMWCYMLGVDDVTALYLCENTHTRISYPGGTFTEVVNNIRIWRKFQGGGGGIDIYINPDPTTASNLEGIPAGSTFPTPGKTMQEMWDLLLYPYQSPKFTEFKFLIHNGILEVGDTFTTDTASWSIDIDANTVPNSVSIAGWNLTTITELPTDGTLGLTFDSPVGRTSIGSQTWTISAQNTNLGTFSRVNTLTWQWMWYWGTSSSTGLTANQITGLTNNGLLSGFVGNYSFATGGYKYICIPDVYCTPTQFPEYFYDLSLGLQVAMDNTGGYFDNNNSTYNKVSVTNAYGLTTLYRTYRTKWEVGAITIIIT